eukprot:Em0003g1201a
MDSKIASSTTGADSGTCEQLEHERTCPCPPQDRMEPLPEYMYTDSPPPYYLVPPPPVEVMQICASDMCASRDDRTSKAPGNLLDNYRLVAILFTAVCFFGGCWPALVCTVPAILFASAAREAKIHGNTTVKENYERAACTLNCGALVACLTIVGCLIASFMKASLLS